MNMYMYIYTQKYIQIKNTAGMCVPSAPSVPSSKRLGHCAMSECAAASRMHVVLPISGGSNCGIWRRPVYTHSYVTHK